MLAFLAWLLLILAALALFSHFLGRRVERILPPQGQFLEVDGERLHYRELGEGPPLVLVHGLAGVMRNFDYLPLQELAQQHRIVLIDRPGSGYSERSDDARAGIAAQAKAVASFIRALGFAQPPLLVGHSLGGAVSLGVALHDPDCIAGVALIAPLTHFVPEVPAPFRGLVVRQRWLRRLLAHTVAVPAAVALSRPAIAYIFKPETTPRDFPLRGGSLLNMRPRAYYASSTDLCALERDLPLQQARYGELRLPVAILFGDGDSLLDWKLHGLGVKEKAPHATVDVVPGGHMLPVTRPAETAAWLQRTAAAMLRPQ